MLTRLLRASSIYFPNRNVKLFLSCFSKDLKYILLLFFTVGLIACTGANETGDSQDQDTQNSSTSDSTVDISPATPPSEPEFVDAGQDGFSFLETLRADPSFEDIPVILLSDGQIKDEQRRWMDVFSKGMLRKGLVSDEELFQTIEKTLNRYGYPLGERSE